jgi:mannan endo-1,4-beta-mannosidase
MRRIRLIAALLVPVVMVAILGSAYLNRHGAPAGHGKVPDSVKLDGAKHCSGLSLSRHYAGVVLYRPQQISLPSFVDATHVRPSIIEYYVTFWQSLDLSRARSIYQNSAFPIVQVDPTGISLASIAQGRYDTYLRGEARAAARFHCPIALSFGHEMNGKWYHWGYHHTRPAVFIAAWQHIHNLFVSAGARNVIWLWTVNRVAPGESPIRSWWPGAQFVDWVGIDAYYRKTTSRFMSVFGKTLSDLHMFARKPALVTETGVPSRPGQARQIAGLFAGARRHHLLGVVWFDINAKQQWRLEGRPVAVKAFRAAASRFASG